MKIAAMNLQTPLPILDKEDSVKVTKTKGSFASELIDKTDENYIKKLEDLLVKIDEQAGKLSQNPTYSELRGYRELVKQFMNESVNRAYLLDTSRGWDSRGRQKVYTTVKKVDDYLASMVEDVRSGQSKQLEIMEKMDAIRGILVDMYT